MPEQLRRIPEDRRRIEQLIPSLVKKVRNLSEHQSIKAAIGLLRYANLRIHQDGAYYASCQGLTAFGLQRPPVWDGLTKRSLKGEGSDEATVATVLGKRGEPVVQAVLVKAACSSRGFLRIDRAATKG